MTVELRACQAHILDALCRKVMDRHAQPVDVWTAGERMAVAVAANEWAERHRMGRRVTAADVEQVEQQAVGHSDYGPKLALYVAELLYRPADALERR